MDDTQITKAKNKKSKGRYNNQNFNFWAAFFGVFYYMYKGLWKKGFLLSVVFMIILMVIQILFPRAPISSLSTGISVSLFGSMANLDLRRKERDGETIWKELPSIFSLNWIVIGLTAVTLFIFIILPVTPYAEMEETSASLVSDILQDDLGLSLQAVDVKILDEVSEDTFSAIATLSDDSVIHFSIEYYPDDEYIEVYIPDQETTNLLGMP